MKACEIKKVDSDMKSFNRRLIGGKFIVITGLDGSGTSTIAEKVTSRDPASVLMKSPPSPFAELRKTIDEDDSIPPISNYLFYLASNVYASQIAISFLKSGRNVYCVRYLIDTVVSSRTHGLDVDLSYETPLYCMKKPDAIFFLKVSESERQDRITKRGKGYLDKRLDNPDFRRAMLREFQRLRREYILIDTTGRTVEDVTSEIQTRLEVI